MEGDIENKNKEGRKEKIMGDGEEGEEEEK